MVLRDVVFVLGFSFIRWDRFYHFSLVTVLLAAETIRRIWRILAEIYFCIQYTVNFLRCCILRDEHDLMRDELPKPAGEYLVNFTVHHRPRR